MTTKSKLRELRMKAGRAGAATVIHLRNRMATLQRKVLGRNRMDATNMKQSFVRAMTNWQRHQWAKAVRADLHLKSDTETVFKADSVQGAQYYANADRATRAVTIEGKVLGYV